MAVSKIPPHLCLYWLIPSPSRMLAAPGAGLNAQHPHVAPGACRFLSDHLLYLLHVSHSENGGFTQSLPGGHPALKPSFYLVFKNTTLLSFKSGSKHTSQRCPNESQGPLLKGSLQHSAALRVLLHLRTVLTWTLAHGL